MSKIRKLTNCLKCDSELNFANTRMCNIRCGVSVCTKCEIEMRKVDKANHGYNIKSSFEEIELALDGRHHESDVPADEWTSKGGSAVRKRLAEFIFENEISHINQEYNL